MHLTTQIPKGCYCFGLPSAGWRHWRPWCTQKNEAPCPNFEIPSNRCSAVHQGRSDGGYIGIYTPVPPKSVYLNFLCGCFVSLQWLVNIYRPTHPNQIPGYASVVHPKIIQ